MDSRHRVWCVLGALLLVVVCALTAGAGWDPDLEPGQEVRVGPVGLQDVSLWEEGDGSTVQITVIPGVADANSIYFSNVFQVQIYLDSPEHNLVLYRAARETRIVTPDFELLQESVDTTIMCSEDIIQFHIPYYHDEMEALVVLTWDPEGQQTYTTPIDGLYYIMNEIDRIGTTQEVQQSEIYIRQQWRQERQQWGQVQESENKGWPAGPGEADPTTGLYNNWPKSVGSTTYWEYSAATGFAKQVHVDLNGNGAIDPGEPHGYIGRCPYGGGINTQQMGDGHCTWISRHNGYNERIRYEFMQDAAGDWVVEATLEESVGGQWVPKASPIVGGPYTTPTDVPGPYDF